MLYPIGCTRCTLFTVHLHLCAVRVPRGDLVAHRYTYSPPRCGTVELLASMVWDRWILRAGPMLFHWPKLLAPFLYSTVSIFSSFTSCYFTQRTITIAAATRPAIHILLIHIHECLHITLVQATLHYLS